MVMRRVVMTTVTLGKPKDDDDDDDDGLEEFMERLKARHGEKHAASYAFHGDVQGVGLREGLQWIRTARQAGHGLQRRLHRPGAGPLPGRSRSHGPIFKELDEHLKAKAPTTRSARCRGVAALAAHDDRRRRRHLPRPPGVRPAGGPGPDAAKQWLADRYRMTMTPEGHLAGHLPGEGHRAAQGRAADLRAPVHRQPLCRQPLAGAEAARGQGRGGEPGQAGPGPGRTGPRDRRAKPAIGNLGRAAVKAPASWPGCPRGSRSCRRRWARSGTRRRRCPSPTGRCWTGRSASSR